MRPLVIGEAPSKNEITPRPLEGRVGRRLALLAGLSHDDYLSTFERLNLLEVRQDRAPKGFTFDMEAAKKAATRLLQGPIVPGRLVLLLGFRVAGAFGLKNERFVKQDLHGAEAYVLPHPSSVNRWWNDADNVKVASTFMHNVVSGRSTT